jgi:hypothetical protein
MPDGQSPFRGARDPQVALSVVILLLGLAMVSAGLEWWPPAADHVADASIRPRPLQQPGDGHTPRLLEFGTHRDLVSPVQADPIKSSRPARKPVADPRAALLDLAKLQRRIPLDRPPGHFAPATPGEKTLYCLPGEGWCLTVARPS